LGVQRNRPDRPVISVYASTRTLIRFHPSGPIRPYNGTDPEAVISHRESHAFATRDTRLEGGQPLRPFCADDRCPLPPIPCIKPRASPELGEGPR
jgi:hypothetical protein